MSFPRALTSHAAERTKHRPFAACRASKRPAFGPPRAVAEKTSGAGAPIISRRPVPTQALGLIFLDDFPPARDKFDKQRSSPTIHDLRPEWGSGSLQGDP